MSRLVTGRHFIVARTFWASVVPYPHVDVKFLKSPLPPWGMTIHCKWKQIQTHYPTTQSCLTNSWHPCEILDRRVWDQTHHRVEVSQINRSDWKTAKDLGLLVPLHILLLNCEELHHLRREIWHPDNFYCYSGIVPSSLAPELLMAIFPERDSVAVTW